ncbi:hypothetical protein [Actinoplanes sp. NPDC051851]|uniref:hypothetical protein n=1 Tax=Actinoplanes sp. NPDC051851 TaxID=3154753 RepID=UPI0034406D56
MTGLLTAELTKIRTLPAVWLALGVALPSGVLLGLLTGAGGSVSIGAPGLVALVPAYVLVAVPAFAGGSEYRHGQLRLSLLAVPSRGHLFAAKLLASTAVTVALAVIVAAPGYLLERGVSATAAGLGARILAYVLLGLIGFGLAVLTRSAVTSIGALVLLPVLVSTTLGGLAPGLVRVLPHEAVLAFLGLTTGLPHPLPAPAGLAVVAAWAALMVAVARSATIRRDG